MPWILLLPLLLLNGGGVNAVFAGFNKIIDLVSLLPFGDPIWTGIVRDALSLWPNGA